MEKLNELLEKQKVLQSEIENLEFGDLKREIEDLKLEERELQKVISEAKVYNQAKDLEIAKGIAHLKLQIKQLNDLSVANLNTRLQNENRLQQLRTHLTKKEIELSSLLAEVKL